MSSIIGDLTIENTKLKAKLAESTAAIKKFKSETEREGAGLGKSLFAGFEKSGIKDVLMGAIGGGSLVGAAVAVKALAEEYGKLYEASLRFNVSTDSMQRLNVLASRAGMDVGSLVGQLHSLAASLENLNDPRISGGLKQLGLTSGDLIGTNPEKQLEKLAEAFAKLKAQGKDAAGVFESLGLGSMIPLLAKYEQSAKAAASVELIKEEELAKMNDAVKQFDLLILKSKAFAAQALTDSASAASAVATMGLSNLIHDTLRMLNGQAPDSAIANLGKPKQAQAAKEAEQKKSEAAEDTAENARLRTGIELREQGMKTPLQQASAQLDQFAEATGTKRGDIGSAMQMKEILQTMKQQAEELRNAGDVKGSNAVLKRFNTAEIAAKSLSESGVETKAPMGSLGGDINRLLGKSGSELVSSKVEEGNTILGRIEGAIKALNGSGNMNQNRLWLDSQGAVFGQ